jgi:hypothetical protein
METMYWTTWSPEGHSLRDSKEHELVYGDNGEVILCGAKIPAEGNGIEHASSGSVDCKKCLAKHED